MAWFHCILGQGTGTGIPLIVECTQNFAGKTISCTDGTTTLHETCPSSSPYEVLFNLPNIGTWTISGVISGQTFSTQVTVTELEAILADIPEGATVTPTNDIQTWLHCANIWDKSYTTLSEVLADTTTLLALISDNNAADYMARSTDWASDESKGLVPTMTSNTAPSGEAFTSNQYSASYQPFHVFDGNTSTYWMTQNGHVSDEYIGYEFTQPIAVGKFTLRNGYNASYADRAINGFRIEGSNDGITYTTLYTGSASQPASIPSSQEEFSFTNNTKYLYYRVYVTSSHGTYNVGATEMQFYGAVGIVNNQTAMGYIGNNDYCAEKLLANSTWLEAICNSTYFESVLNVKVPTMTSDTTPSGEVIYNSQYSSFKAWQAFGNLNNTAYENWAVQGNGSNVGYLGYEFDGSSVKVYKVYMQNRNQSEAVRAIKKFKIQGSNTNNSNDWHDISMEFSNPSNDRNAESNYKFTSAIAYKYIRLFVTDVYDTTFYGIGKLQFYGRA